MANTSTATRWPNFFIVGAARSGTSSFYYYLKGHPEIYMSELKEPHFFSAMNDGQDRSKYYLGKVVTDEPSYHSLFEGAGTETVVGEASTGYLYDEGAANRIYAVAPEAKIIVILRNPIERAFSHYSMHVAGGTQRNGFYDAVLEDQARSPKGLGFSYLYVERGLYYSQVKRYFDTFGSDQVRVYLFEDFESETATVVRDACLFLDVPYLDGDFFVPEKKYRALALPPRFLRPIIGNRYIRSLATAAWSDRMTILLQKLFRETKNPKAPLDERAKRFLSPIIRNIS